MLATLLLACGAGVETPETPAEAFSPVSAESEASQAEPLEALVDFSEIPAPRHAVVLLIDTLRSDALAEAHTPTIDALRQGGVSPTLHWSAGTWTVPSIVSLFLGMPIRQHGWDEPSGHLGRYPPLPDSPTLAGVLSDAGFESHGLYANPYLAEELGFDRGFDQWRRSADKSIPRQFASLVEEHFNGKRQFVYLHLLGPHSPLRPSEAARIRWEVDPSWFEERFGLEIGVAKRNRRPGAREAYAAAYRAVIEDTDLLVAAILDALGEHREDTLVLLTSDHGELLGEHNIAGHGTHVWEPLTRVPLILNVPGGRPSLPERVGGAEIPHLLTSLLRVEHTWPTSLGTLPSLVSQREGLLALTEDGLRKGIWAEELQVYSLDDPGEEEPLAQDGRLEEARVRWESAVPKGSPPAATLTLPEETVEQLQSLGYGQ